MMGTSLVGLAEACKKKKKNKMELQFSHNELMYWLDFPTRRTIHIMPHPRVQSLHVYPVKACKGIDVETAFFERTGKLAKLHVIRICRCIWSSA